MNAPLDITRRSSVCQHDCPSVCALDVEVIGGSRIGRVHGAADHPYTQGSRLRESGVLFRRIHHSRPAHRGPCGALARKQFSAVCADLLGRSARPRRRGVPESRARMEATEGVWPYFYAGTMGLVMRDGIERLTHVKGYSRFYGTICVGIAWPELSYCRNRAHVGASPSEMAKSEVVVIWGTNAVATQVNLMTLRDAPRKEHWPKLSQSTFIRPRRCGRRTSRYS